jgi:hypothetical protein
VRLLAEVHRPGGVQFRHVLHNRQRLLYACRVLLGALVEAAQVLYEQLVALRRLQGVQQLGGFVEAVLQGVRLLSVNRCNGSQMQDVSKGLWVLFQV